MAASHSSPLILEDSIAKMRTSQWSSFDLNSEPAQMWGAGDNSYGQLNTGVRDNLYSSPVQAPGTTWVYVASGSAHNLAIKSDGTLWTIGFNGNGPLGDGTNTNRSSPIQLAGTTWKFVSGGSSHSHAVKTDGHALGMGSKWYWSTR